MRRDGDRCDWRWYLLVLAVLAALWTILAWALYLTDDRKPKPLVKVAGGPAIRTCLNCGKPFESDWIGNRICDTCMKLTEMQYNESCY